MKTPKIIPLYLPQFHQIPENDKWWGKGFTEWVNVRNAKKLKDNHNQPRIPLDNNYYDLLNIDTLKWQCKIAREHGIYGFAIYHYWFNGKMLLEKPMQILLEHPDIDINYCISWANHDWTDAWKCKGGIPKILITHDYKDENDWESHFLYFMKFFKDSRYMIEDNKPLLIIYFPHLIPNLNEMLDYWTKRARESGFNGIEYIYQSAQSCFNDNWDRSKFSHGMQFHPAYVQYANESKGKMFLYKKLIPVLSKIKRNLGIKKSFIQKEHLKIDRDYDEDWQNILRLKPSGNCNIPCAMVDWDNTPRKGKNGWYYSNASPAKFKKYFRQLVLKCINEYKSDKIFVFAWNEWAEGGYLEPDTKFGYGYLESISEVLEEYKRNETYNRT